MPLKISEMINNCNLRPLPEKNIWVKLRIAHKKYQYIVDSSYPNLITEATLHRVADIELHFA